MTLKTDAGSTRFRRTTIISFVVFLGSALPLGILFWSVSAALADKLPFRNCKEFNSYRDGCVQQGELYFPVYRPAGCGPSQSYDYRIKRLNLATGAERETEFVVPNDLCIPYWSNTELIGLSYNDVYQRVNQSLVKFARPARSVGFSAGFFQYNGQLTTANEAEDGGYRLLHLVDAEWVEGPRILLPGLNRVWYEDLPSGRTKLLPVSSSQPTSVGPAAQRFGLYVVQSGESTHLIMWDTKGFYAYRNGFEFAVENELASAMAPENSTSEVSGWEAIPLFNIGDYLGSIECDRHGLLLATWNMSADSPGRLIRRDHNGQWIELECAEEVEMSGLPSIIVDRSTDRTFLISGHQDWSYAVFYPIEKDSVLPARFKFSGAVDEYLWRWKRLFLGIVFAWATHSLILAGGALFIESGSGQGKYQFGSQQATLAPVWRRALAAIVDLLVLLSIPLALTYAQWQTVKFIVRADDEKNFCQFLWGIEQAFTADVTLDDPIFTGGMNSRCTTFPTRYLAPFSNATGLVQLSMIMVLILYALKVCVEAWCGVTPGKWLLGIRTMRSTLRPCGLANALVRNLIRMIEVPFALTPLPAALSTMLSEHCQRLGDRIADTIVIHAGSIQERTSELEIAG